MTVIGFHGVFVIVGVFTGCSVAVGNGVNVGGLGVGVIVGVTGV
jgi:hypothetical protein